MCSDAIHGEAVDIVDVHDSRDVSVWAARRLVGNRTSESLQVSFGDAVLLAHTHGRQATVTDVSPDGSYVQSENVGNLLSRVHSNAHIRKLPYHYL